MYLRHRDTDKLWVDMFTKALGFDKFDEFRRYGSGLLKHLGVMEAAPSKAKLVTLAYVWAMAHLDGNQLALTQ